DLRQIAALSARLLPPMVVPKGPIQLDPLNVAEPMLKFAGRAMFSPIALARAQFDLTRRSFGLAKYTAARLLGRRPDPVAPVPRGDRRFRDDAWSEELVFDFMKQAHLLTATWLQDSIARIHSADDETRARVQFYAAQLSDALAPSNFVLTNPEVLRETIRSKGTNLIRGFRHLLEDLREGEGSLFISMTDSEAFEVGHNVATMPGKVVFENRMLQLLQYTPSTEKVHETPLVIFPPWINKFYILDLQPENSFIKWAVDQGYTVFVASWVNPDESYADVGFEDYMNDGIYAALEAIEAATGQREVNAIGYCIGGTLLAATLARMAALKDDRIRTATFFTAQVDFSEAGDLRMFIDERQLDQLDERMEGSGYLDGRDMATAFNMLRANDLIWSFVVNNYLMGQKPRAFDLLYWNSDATRMPEAMHSYYLREMYLHNKLVEPGGITLGDVPIDLRRIELPIYIQSSETDHIAPYHSVYKATRLYSGPVRFMMAGSGHIAGVVNPPSAEKYWHKVNNETPETVEEWIDGAEKHTGSWWPDWDAWLAPQSGKQVPARVPGDGALDVIEDAPGRYVAG
ncbi:MAG: class I poly(R)-hydroxyalkanoic acid synthase, partial [Pseudomonadota bacterium]